MECWRWLVIKGSPDEHTHLLFDFSHSYTRSKMKRSGRGDTHKSYDHIWIRFTRTHAGKRQPELLAVLANVGRAVKQHARTCVACLARHY